jgi:hypothetical protein
MSKITDVHLSLEVAAWRVAPSVIDALTPPDIALVFVGGSGR